MTEVGKDQKIIELVYVAVFAPEDSESIDSVSKPNPPAPLGSGLRLDMQGLVIATRKGAAKEIAQDLAKVKSLGSI